MLLRLRQFLPESFVLRNFVARNKLSMSKKKTTTEKQERKKNWREYTATVEDIQRSTSGRFACKELHHGQADAAA